MQLTVRISCVGQNGVAVEGMDNCLRSVVVFMRFPREAKRVHSRKSWMPARDRQVSGRQLWRIESAPPGCRRTRTSGARRPSPWADVLQSAGGTTCLTLLVFTQVFITNGEHFCKLFRQVVPPKVRTNSETVLLFRVRVAPAPLDVSRRWP